MGWALVAAMVAFGSTSMGGLTALRWPNRIGTLMALAGGVVMGAAFFDLLPDAVQRAVDLHLNVNLPLGAVLVGFLFFQSLERILHHYCTDEESHLIGTVGAVGFIVHSVFDGLAIGLAFRVTPGLGLLVALAVIGHDFSDGLNTVSYLLAHKHERRSSLQLLFLDAAAPLVGAAIASLVPVPAQVFPVALGFFSGLFIFAATVNLLPRARELPVSESVGITTAGALAMFLISRFA